MNQTLGIDQLSQDIKKIVKQTKKKNQILSTLIHLNLNPFYKLIYRETDRETRGKERRNGGRGGEGRGKKKKTKEEDEIQAGT